MKLILLFIICMLGFAHCAKETINKTATTFIKSTAEEPFETHSLNLHSYENPLIIKSRNLNIPINSPSSELPQFKIYENKQISSPSSTKISKFVPLPYSIPNYGISSLSHHLPSSSVENFSPFFAPQSYAFNPGFLSSVENGFPSYSSSGNFFYAPRNTEIPFSFNPHHSLSFGLNDFASVHPTIPTHTLKHSPDYVLLQVPEVASYSDFGQFSASSIPSVSELDAIFSTSTLNQNLPSSEEKKSTTETVVVESRSNVESDKSSESTTITPVSSASTLSSLDAEKDAVTEIGVTDGEERTTLLTNNLI